MRCAGSPRSSNTDTVPPQPSPYGISESSSKKVAVFLNGGTRLGQPPSLLLDLSFKTASADGTRPRPSTGQQHARSGFAIGRSFHLNNRRQTDLFSMLRGHRATGPGFVEVRTCRRSGEPQALLPPNRPFALTSSAEEGLLSVVRRKRPRRFVFISQDSDDTDARRNLCRRMVQRRCEARRHAFAKSPDDLRAGACNPQPIHGPEVDRIPARDTEFSLDDKPLPYSAFRR